MSVSVLSTSSIQVEAFETELNAYGCAVLRNVLSVEECAALAGSYGNEELFRSRVVMARHGFGRGEYKYFAYPLPELVTRLRTELYPALAEMANRWNEALRVEARFPARHDDYLEQCHQAGQTKPT